MTLLENRSREPLWPAFEKYCKEQMISLEHEDDWYPWWHCFVNGANSSLELQEKQKENV